MFRRLQLEVPSFSRFQDWDEVLELMRNRSGSVEEKNQVFTAICQAYRKESDHRWRTILLAILWPGLTKLHCQKINLDPSHVDLWANILMTFLNNVCLIDVAACEGRFVQKILNKTAHRLHDIYRRARNRSAREMSMDQENLEGVAGGVLDKGQFSADYCQGREAQAVLREHVDAGRISEADFLLLVGIHVYGRSIRDCAQEAGITREAAKKRAQRAIQAIRSFWKA